MAVDESTLYTIINQEITRSSLVQEMINFYQFNDGDFAEPDDMLLIRLLQLILYSLHLL